MKKKKNETQPEEHEQEITDDVEIEEDEEAVAKSDNVQKKVKKLQDKLKKCQEEKEEYLDKWQRQKADFINARKRDEDEKQRAIKNASAAVIGDLIPVIDSFHMAFADKDAWEQTPENWRTGIEHVYNQLRGVLRDHGVTEIDPAGQTFDPQYNEAVERVAVDDTTQDNVVTDVLQKGYELNGTVLRAAKVKVGHYEAAGEGDGDVQEE